MTLIKRATKLTLDGVGTHTIRPSDYVTQGGEGVIYRAGTKMLKLAHNQTEFIAADMPGKVQLLRSALSHPSIVVPTGLVRTARGLPIGIHVPFVNGEPFPRLFTTSWQKQNRFGIPEITTLASTMRDVVTHAHSAGALMVDANELNWLADVSDPRRSVPYIIDVDSWQIGAYPATVVMPSIRDWHAPISQASDWFAWGVVTFLLYTGIHPYRGSITGYKPGDLERRMQDNVSVFRPEVKLNRAVRELTAIPGPLLDWYRATFEAGERTLPPSPHATGSPQTTVGRTLHAITTQTGGLVYEELLRIPGADIVSVWPCGVVRTSDNRLIDLATKRTVTHVTGSRIAVVAQASGHLIAELIGDTWQIRFVSNHGAEHRLSLALTVNDMVRSGDRLFTLTDHELVELTLHEFARPLLTTGTRWSIPIHATRWLSGFGVSDVLGAMHLVVPESHGEVAIVRAAELDGLRIIAGTSSGRIAVVLAVDRSGHYRVFTFAGTQSWRRYDVHTRDAHGPDLNVAVLPKGVTAEIRDDGELIVAVPSQGTVRVVNDKNLHSTMRLTAVGNRVVYHYDGALWTLRMT